MLSLEELMKRDTKAELLEKLKKTGKNAQQGPKLPSGRLEVKKALPRASEVQTPMRLHIDPVGRHKQVDLTFAPFGNLHFERAEYGIYRILRDFLADKSVEVLVAQGYTERFYLFGVYVDRFAADFAPGKFFYHKCGKFQRIHRGIGVETALVAERGVG